MTEGDRDALPPDYVQVVALAAAIEAVRAAADGDCYKTSRALQVVAALKPLIDPEPDDDE